MLLARFNRTMQDEIEFDNVLIGKDELEAHDYGTKSWGPKHAFEAAEEVNHSCCAIPSVPSSLSAALSSVSRCRRPSAAATAGSW